MACLGYVKELKRWRVRWRATCKKPRYLFQGSKVFMEKVQAVAFWSEIEAQERLVRSGQVTPGESVQTAVDDYKRHIKKFTPSEHLKSYVRGQVSSLQRKSAEPIALLAKTPPRTLPYVHWDQQRLRDRIQWIVAKDHAHPDAIGIVDDTGHPKKGTHIACVQRQWCGKTGKKDNCLVSVHIVGLEFTAICISAS